MGLTEGVASGTFGLGASVTREQAAAMVARWLVRSAGLDLTALYPKTEAESVLASFSDAGSVSSALLAEMAYAVHESVLHGDNGHLYPRTVLTRIQGAALILRSEGLLGGTTTTTSLSGSTTTTGSTATTSPTTTSTSTTTTTTTTTSTTTSTSPGSTTSTTSASAAVYGVVMGTDGRPVAGATVKVVLDAADAHYQSGGNNIVGTATADQQGHYQVAVAGLAAGSTIDVSATASGYTSILAYGTYDEVREEVDFTNFGTSGGDRRLPVGEVIPPLPFEGLLPE